MNNRIYSKITASLSLCIMISGCMHDIPEPAVPMASQDSCESITSHESGIKTIIQNTCALSGCHVMGGFKDMSSYMAISVVIQNYGIENFIARYSAGGGMPPEYSSGPKQLTACEKLQLTTWLRNGYPEN